MGNNGCHQKKTQWLMIVYTFLQLECCTKEVLHIQKQTRKQQKQNKKYLKLHASENPAVEPKGQKGRVQLSPSSVPQSCPTLCDPMEGSSLKVINSKKKNK